MVPQAHKPRLPYVFLAALAILAAPAVVQGQEADEPGEAGADAPKPAGKKPTPTAKKAPAEGGADEPGAEDDWDDSWQDGWDEADDESQHAGEMTMTGHEDPREAAEVAASKGKDKDGGASKDVQKGFIKGELSAAGRIQLVSRYHRMGMKLGATGFNKQIFAHIDPVLDLNFHDIGLKLGFSAPLNFLAADTDETLDDAFKEVGAFRSGDWDEFGDFLQVIRYATYGGKEQPFFLSLTQLDSVSIGHGTVVRRYVSNLDVNRHRLGGQFDAYNEYGGFELYANDLVGPNVIGTLAFMKPGRLISEDRPLGRLSVGAHYTADLGAPVSLQCSELTTYPCEMATRMGYFAVKGTHPHVTSNEGVQFVGVDVEFKPVRTASVDLKPYLDYTQMLGYGAGMTLGLLGRFNLGLKRNSALRLRLEGRSYDAQYLPAYFDILYEVDRYVSLASVNADKNARTKLAYVKSLAGEDRRLGYYLEATYALRGWFALTGAWEQANADASKSVLLHLELPASKWFTLFFTYVKRNFSTFDSDPTDFRRTDYDATTPDISDELFFWAFRVKILPILAFNWRGQKAFEIRSDKARPARYMDVFHYVGTMELGYEF